jgi:hypothetical protein
MEKAYIFKNFCKIYLFVMVKLCKNLKIFGILNFLLFLSDLSFHIQYKNNSPFSSDVESIKVITWGFQYWF